MLSEIALLTVAFVVGTRAASDAVPKEEGKASPLTQHLLKLVNHFDDNIIGFHLVVPRDDEMAKGFDSKPAPISKILEYVSQINFLRNLIDNDPEVSLKKERSLDERIYSTTPSAEIKECGPHHTDLLIFSQLNQRQSTPVKLSPSARHSASDSGSLGAQNLPLKGVFSKVTGSKTNSSAYLKSKNMRRTFSPDEVFDLKKFKEGFRVFPLIPLETKAGNVESFTDNEGKRIRREVLPDNLEDDNFAFLVQPYTSPNPSILLLPRSISERTPQLDSTNQEKKPFEKYYTKRSLNLSKTNNIEKENSIVSSDLTFLAPLVDSALVLPKSKFGETTYNANSPRDNYEEKLSENGLLFNSTLSNVSCPINRGEVNYTPNVSEDYSFAEILRESITDLVNGVDQESLDKTGFENSEDSANHRLTDYNVYLLVDDNNGAIPPNDMIGGRPEGDQSDQRELYSSPKSKINRINSYGDHDFTAFHGFSQLWPKFPSSKNKAEIVNNICSSNLKENDPFYEINSLYKSKVGEILSHTKRGYYGKKIKRRVKRSNTKYNDKKNYATVNSGNKLFVKYDPKRFSLYQNLLGQNNLSSNRDKRGSQYFSPSISHSNCTLNSSFYEMLKKTLLAKRESSAPRGNGTDFKRKILARTNRSPGSIVMIPQGNRNFDLLIVCPYSTKTNKKMKTIVSKSVKKINGFNSTNKSKPNLGLTCNNLLKHLALARLKMPETSLENLFLNEKKSSQADLRNVVGLIDALKSDVNFERDDVGGEQVAVRKDFNVPLSLLSSLKSVGANPYTLAQNLSDFSRDKQPQGPDFNVKLLQSETDSPYRSKSILDTLNISSSASVEALKSSIPQQPGENDNLLTLALTTESVDLLPPNSSEALNSANLMKPFLNTNGFRVSNGSNLLIKLTELKPSLEAKVFDSEEAKMTTDGSITSGVILMQKPFPRPSSGKSSTKRPFSSFFKSSKKVSYTGTAGMEVPKSVKNETEQMSQYEVQEVNASNMNGTCDRQLGLTNVYTFTEAYDAKPSSIPGVEPSIVHTTRPWAASCGSNTTGEEVEETTDDLEDLDDAGYPDFAPVISVNIFPIVGGWRKPQIEALSLIKELLKTAQQLKVEEEQLPTYLSELFDVSEDKSPNHCNKTKDNIQRKLDTILSGQCSINDILKLKVQNILQRSNKSAKVKST